MLAGRAPRIASASIPARVLAAGAGDVRSVPRLAGQPQARPGLFMRARRRGCGLSPGRSPGSWAPKLPSST